MSQTHCGFLSGGGGGGNMDNGSVRPNCCGIRRLIPLKWICSCCPQIKESKSTKCIYSLFVVVATGLMSVMTLPSAQHYLLTIFRDFTATCTDLNIRHHNCLKLTGYMAAFKISFSFCFLFIGLCLMTVGVTSSKGTRSYIHNGFWFCKMICVFTLIVAIFVIPISHLSQLHSAWVYLNLIGNWIFMMVQLIILIESSETLSGYLRKMATHSSYLISWKLIETGLALIIFCIWLIMSIVLYLSHGQQKFCLTKQMGLIFSTGFCICIILASLTPCARKSFTQKHNEQLRNPSWDQQKSIYTAQITQSALIAVYITFWVWSAMQSAPESPGIVELALLVDENDMTCIVYQNPFVEQSLTYTSITMMLFTIAYFTSRFTEVKKDASSQTTVSENYLNSIITDDEPTTKACFCMAHSGVGHHFGYTSSSSNLNSIKIPDSMIHLERIDPVVVTTTTNNPHRRRLIIKDEFIRTTYSYSLLHFMMILSIMFATTQLTRWFQPNAHELQFIDRSWNTVGLKLATGWSCGLIYLLYLLLPDRCFNLCRRRNSSLSSPQIDPLIIEARLPSNSSNLQNRSRFHPSNSILTHM